jgi:hypothetical protein
MPQHSPVKPGTGNMYKPHVVKTVGHQRPACLVNATVTWCGERTIIAFGGFDTYTDEVYNHVLRLDLNTHQWSLGMSTLPHISLPHTPQGVLSFCATRLTFLSYSRQLRRYSRGAHG